MFSFSSPRAALALKGCLSRAASTTTMQSKGFLAAFLACATSTLLLFGWYRDEAVDGEDRQSYDQGSGDGSSSTIFSAFSEDVVGARGCASASNGDDAGPCGCSLLLCSMLGGFSGAIGEVLPLRLDDNLSMPVVSGVIFLALHQWWVLHAGGWAAGQGEDTPVSHVR